MTNTHIAMVLLSLMIAYMLFPEASVAAGEFAIIAVGVLMYACFIIILVFFLVVGYITMFPLMLVLLFIKSVGLYAMAGILLMGATGL